MSKFERKFSKYAINNLMYYLILLYSVGLIIWIFDPNIYFKYLMLDFSKIASFQIWRLFTFLIYPVGDNVLIAIITMFVYYMIGNNVEKIIGTFRFNILVFSDIILTIIIRYIHYLIFGYGATYIANSILNLNIVFLNLIMLIILILHNPEQRFLFYFIIPVKAKWFLILIAIYYVTTFYNGTGIVDAIASLITLVVYYVLFGIEMSKILKKRKFKKNVVLYTEISKEKIPKHRCSVCGKTDISDPDMEFRYCSKCSKMQEYCSEHLFDHNHE